MATEKKEPSDGRPSADDDYFLRRWTVDTIEDAVAIAKRIPSARTGTVEVRPLVERAAEANA